jgi:hypothetical protein
LIAAVRDSATEEIRGVNFAAARGRAMWKRCHDPRTLPVGSPAPRRLYGAIAASRLLYQAVTHGSHWAPGPGDPRLGGAQHTSDIPAFKTSEAGHRPAITHIHSMLSAIAGTACTTIRWANTPYA